MPFSYYRDGNSDLHLIICIFLITITYYNDMQYDKKIVDSSLLFSRSQNSVKLVSILRLPVFNVDFSIYMTAVI
jgi:hypothetical protein